MLAQLIERYKPLLPIPALLAVLPLLWLFFRRTWKELDQDAQRHGTEMLERGEVDRRPFVALSLCAFILTAQEYYGGRAYYEVAIKPALLALEARGTSLQLARFEELWGFVWWSGTRVGGYTLPLLVWRFAFPKDRLLDFGLRARGFLDHAWIYGLFFAIVVPAMLVVAQSPDFGTYYPFYKNATRSWVDFLLWEALYFAQFFALELFFRGFWLGALRKSFGSGAIFVMAVPYCMIHYGKPYLEACGAIIAGIALGSLAMKTKSIYSGVLIHVTVALMMDWLSLRHRSATPLHFWPSDANAANLLGYVDPAAREALARTVERTAGVVFLVGVGIVVALVLRRRKLARAIVV